MRSNERARRFKKPLEKEQWNDMENGGTAPVMCFSPHIVKIIPAELTMRRSRTSCHSLWPDCRCYPRPSRSVSRDLKCRTIERSLRFKRSLSRRSLSHRCSSADKYTRNRKSVSPFLDQRSNEYKLVNLG